MKNVGGLSPPVAMGLCLPEIKEEGMNSTICLFRKRYLIDNKRREMEG